MLGTNIREYRKKLGLTMKDLAESTGLSIGYISQVEREEVEPSLSSLRKIAGSFDVPVYILMDDHKNDRNLTIRREERLSVE
ncbi:helix-turn-helix transcriptional regulator [[Clostridium] symbiosum]